MNKGLLLALLISFSCASNIAFAKNPKGRDQQSCEHAAKGKKKEERKAFIKGCMEGKKHAADHQRSHKHMSNDPYDTAHRKSAMTPEERLKYEREHPKPGIEFRNDR